MIKLVPDTFQASFGAILLQHVSSELNVLKQLYISGLALRMRAISHTLQKPAAYLARDH